MRARSDVLDHPVVTRMRLLAEEADSADASGDVSVVETLRGEMLGALTGVAEAVDDVREAALAETVVPAGRRMRVSKHRLGGTSA